MKTAGRKMLESAAAALKKNNFGCSLHETAAEAAQYLLEMAGTGKQVGLGGSMTVSEMDLPRRLAEAGNTLITHTPDMDHETRIKTWLNAQAADLYLASPQAVTMTGELVLLDGTGNRAAACIYGPKKVVLIAGVNKLAKDLEQAMSRSRNVAALANNIRLDRKNPCVKTGKCVDCASPERICNVSVLFHKKPRHTDLEVVLVNEELGY